MSLLTPSESHAFQNFLTQMDHPDQVSSDWNMYQDYHDSTHLPPMQGNEALAKATKDLMSLDTDRWPIQQQNQQVNYDYYPPQHQYGRYESQFSRPQHSRRTATFPFLNKQPQHPHLQIPPVHHSMNADPMSSSSSHSFPSISTPSSSSSTSFGQQMLVSPTSPVSAGTKRPSESAMMPISKRSRPSPPLYSSPTLTSGTKPTLLSPSQKKANHIQSEQKRRANIRRGYEALCETVPSLREAIQQEEALASRGGKDTKGKSKKPKGRGKTDDTAGEKVDGRAGPRSENVVLVKTIDYINDLRSEQAQLLQRLEMARAILPPGHPALFPASQPLWEREWKGGEEEADASEEAEEDGE